MFESVDEIGHFAHIRNLWIIRQQLEHFLYPEAKLELARESRLYSKGVPRKYRLRVPNLQRLGSHRNWADSTAVVFLSMRTVRMFVARFACINALSCFFGDRS